jgi:prepilin-type N-terminal cleavage/methylation domain-containing protein
MKLRTMSRRRGFSLVEIAMVLAIAALIIAGVMLFFGNASSNQKSNDTIAEVANIAQIVRSLYAGQSDYTGITTAVVAQSGQMPAKWVSGVTALNNPFGKSVVISTASGTSQFSIALSGLPAAACVKLATYDLGTGTYGTLAGNTASYGGPVSPATAQTACASSSANTVTYYLY